MGVNLKGPFRLSALVGTRMAGPDHGGSDGGSIIFVSSIASHRPSPNELVYGAAKAGINNLTYGLARTLGPKVRVNCIVPGPFLTDISKAWDLDAFTAAGEGGIRARPRRRTRTRSSAPRSTSPATRRRTRPAR